MNFNKYDNPKNSLELYELNDKFKMLTKLYLSKKIPKVLMLSGNKGIGKFTLINHFLSYIFDKENYDIDKMIINSDTTFYKQYLNNTFPNILHLSADNFKNIKIEDVRDLKKQLLKSTISNKERFIILDDIELFNINSLNALLKIIEEPSVNNNFVLINNKTKPLIETIYSRSVELKINLSSEMQISIIDKLVKKNNLELLIDYKETGLTPGFFLSFNNILLQNNININEDLLINMEKIIILYKKEKRIELINLLVFIVDNYFYNLKIKENRNIDNIMENKNFVLENISKFVSYNLNHNSLINAINNRLTNG